MNILIAGGDGQLGRELERLLEEKKPSFCGGGGVFALGRRELDICDRAAVLSFCRENKIGAVFNCAAYTDVNAAESQEEAAYAVNALGAENLALAMEEARGILVHVSTDYVFDGKKTSPYTESDPCAPLGAYGRTKLAGERLVLSALPSAAVLRTAWLYGREGKNFVNTVLRVAGEKGEMRVVSDQFGTPTFTQDLARHMLTAAREGLSGIFHATCKGSCSWFDLACETVRLAGLKARILPCTTEEYPTPAARPKNSVLENARLSALGLDAFRPWEEALRARFSLL